MLRAMHGAGFYQVDVLKLFVLGFSVEVTVCTH